MSNAIWTKLEDVCLFENGDRGSNYPSKSAFVSSGIPFVNAGNIMGNELVSSTFDYITKEKYSSLRAGKFSKDDILFCLRGTIGKCAISKDYAGAIASSLVIIRPKENITTDYLFYMLTSPYFQQSVANCNNGSVQGNISVDVLKKLFIPVPNKQEQESISGILKVIDEKVSNNKKLMNEIEETARLIYDYWFTQFDFPDENGKPYRSSGGAMVYNSTLHREIPAGWEVIKLDNAADVLFGYPLATTMFGEKGTPVVRIRDISEGTFSALTSEVVDETYYTNVGDLLIGMDGNFQMAFWHRKNDIVNQRISRIRKTTFPLLPMRFQIEPYIKSKVDSVARSTVGHLSNADIRDFNLVVPPAEHDLAIFDVILSMICSLQKEAQALVELRDWLLPMLMNGQVAVYE